MINTLDTPCGVLPVLEYDGTTIAQSISIARFLAREFNLAGKNRAEEAQADMIVDCVSDVLNSKNCSNIYKSTLIICIIGKTDIEWLRLLLTSFSSVFHQDSRGILEIS